MILNKKVIFGVAGDPCHGSFSYFFGVPIQGLTFLDNIFLDTVLPVPNIDLGFDGTRHAFWSVLGVILVTLGSLVNI